MSGDGGGAPFAFVHHVDVRFSDLDPMGHAHHALPLIWFEEARAAYWREVTGKVGLDGIDYIMAGATLSYHARVLYPGRLSVGVRAGRLGGKSFELSYELRSEAGELLASGTTTQVMFDYDAGESKPIPDEVRRRVAELDGAVRPAG